MTDQASLCREVAKFQAPVLHKSLSQLVTSIGGFLATCAAMYALFDMYWVALALVPLAAGFLVRIFIIQHDCGHLSFFRSRRTNDIIGFACSLLTLTPYASWRRQHAGHHGVWNDLDQCHERIVALCNVTACSFRDGLRALGFALWDEVRGRMVTFREAATDRAKP